jgi:hypothetical protein
MVEPQNQGRRFGLRTTGTVFSGLASKSVVTVSLGLVSKPVARVYPFAPQNRQLWFGDLGLKITVTVSWFGSQNQAGFGLSIAPQNRWREDDVGHTSRSSGLLCLEARRARVFQSDLKNGRGATAGGAGGTIVEVASESS